MMSILNEALEALKAGTPEAEKKYRIGNVYDDIQGKATILTYVDARYVQDTLDKYVGPECWSNNFIEIKGNMFCEITIEMDGQSVSKMDCGVESNVEKQKGEASDAFKRAAVMFGIGRDLYSSETLFADLEKKGGKWRLPFGWKPHNSPPDKYNEVIPKKEEAPKKEEKPKTNFDKFIPDFSEDNEYDDKEVAAEPTGKAKTNTTYGTDVIGFKSGNNVGKSYGEVDFETLHWIITDCKVDDWKSKAKTELDERNAANTAKIKAAADEDIPF